MAGPIGYRDIQRGIESLKDISSEAAIDKLLETLFSKGKIVIPFGGGTEATLTIRFIHPEFLKKIEKLPEKTELLREMHKQFQQQNVIYGVKSHTQERQLYLTNQAQKEHLSEKHLTKYHNITTLEQEELDAIAEKAGEVFELFSKLIVRETAPQGKAEKETKVQPAKNKEPQAQQRAAGSFIATAAATTQKTRGERSRERAKENREVEAEHYKKDIKQAKEQRLKEKDQRVKDTEKQRQELRREPLKPKQP